MRTRALVVMGLLTVPCVLSAQGGRIPVPRPGTRGVPTAVGLPPEAPVVARALAYKRSRWSAEGYTLISAIQVPGANGGTENYATFGTGTHADYRFGDRFSASVDLTMSPIGTSAITQTAELGTRFRPTPYGSDLRPFFDLRMGYMRMNDTYASPTNPTGGFGAASSYSEIGRYSSGFGGVAGVGFEYSLTNTLALITEGSAMRNRMTTYRLSGDASLPGRNSFWLTSARLTVGVRYNAARALHSVQNPGM